MLHLKRATGQLRRRLDSESTACSLLVDREREREREGQGQMVALKKAYRHLRGRFALTVFGNT